MCIKCQNAALDIVKCKGCGSNNRQMIENGKCMQCKLNSRMEFDVKLSNADLEKVLKNPEAAGRKSILGACKSDSYCGSTLDSQGYILDNQGNKRRRLVACQKCRNDIPGEMVHLQPDLNYRTLCKACYGKTHTFLSQLPKARAARVASTVNKKKSKFMRKVTHREPLAKSRDH